MKKHMIGLVTLFAAVGAMASESGYQESVFAKKDPSAPALYTAALPSGGSSSSLGSAEAALLMHVIDWGQTRQISRNCHAHPSGVVTVEQQQQFINEGWTDYKQWYETHRNRESNPVLGDCPSLGRINAYYMLSGAALYAASKYLPQPWNKVTSWTWLVVETGFVAHNFKFGVQFNF